MRTEEDDYIAFQAVHYYVSDWPNVDIELEGYESEYPGGEDQREMDDEENE